VQTEGFFCTGGYGRFFYLALIHESLANMYQLNFALMHHHKYSLTEIENMMPFERDIYVALLKKHLDEQEERMKQRNG